MLKSNSSHLAFTTSSANGELKHENTICSFKSLHPYLLQRTHIHFQRLKVKTKSSITRTVSVWKIWKQSFRNVSLEGKQSYSKFIEIIKFTSTQQIWYRIISQQQCSHLLRISLWFKTAIHYETLSTLLHKPKLCPISELRKPKIPTLGSRGLCLPICRALHFGNLIVKQFLTSEDLFCIIKSGVCGQMFKRLIRLPKALRHWGSVHWQQRLLMTREADQLQAFLLMNPALHPV